MTTTLASSKLLVGLQLLLQWAEMWISCDTESEAILMCVCSFVSPVAVDPRSRRRRSFLLANSDEVHTFVYDRTSSTTGNGFGMREVRTRKDCLVNSIRVSNFRMRNRRVTEYLLDCMLLS